MNIAKTIGRLPLKALIKIIQVPLTVIYFVLSFFGSVISGMGWLTEFVGEGILFLKKALADLT